MPRLPVVLVLATACSPLPAPEERAPLASARVLDPGCVGSAYTGIQQAIDDAVDDDVIEICPGTYAERLTISGKRLTLRSTGGAAVTTIDGEHLGKTLSVKSGADVIVEGLTFANGDGGSGRGGNVHCKESALVLRDNVLVDGEAEKGGGLSVRSCTGTAENNTFQGNHAGKGGAAYIEGADNAFDVVGNDVLTNTSTSQGAGVYIYDGDALVDGNYFFGNRTRAEGGGLRVKIASATITNNVFVANHAEVRGGAVKISHDDVVMSGNSYQRNTAGQQAGAVLLFESASVLTGEVYEGNSARFGGALVIVEGWGDVRVEDSTFSGNTAEFGGHLFVGLEGYTTTLRRVDLVDGSAEQGGAVYAQGSDLVLESTLLEGNVATVSGGALQLDGVTGGVTNGVAIWNDAPVGAALAVANGAAFDVVNTVFTENWTGAAVAVTSGLAPVLRYDDFFQNASDVSGLPDPIGVDGNVALATDFVDAQAGDFSLQPTSLLIDAGDPAILDVGGSRSDLGLFGGPSSR